MDADNHAKPDTDFKVFLLAAAPGDGVTPAPPGLLLAPWRQPS
jgi:hypothetical protein